MSDWLDFNNGYQKMTDKERAEVIKQLEEEIEWPSDARKAKQKSADVETLETPIVWPSDVRKAKEKQTNAGDLTKSTPEEIKAKKDFDKSLKDFDKTYSFPSTLYKGMPTDDLAAVSAYEVQDAVDVVNNFRRKTIEGIDTLKNSIVDSKIGGFIIKDNIKELIKSGDIDRIKKEGLGMLASNAARMAADIAPGLLDSITDGLSDVAGKILESKPVTLLKDGADYILKDIKSSDLAKGMASLLDEVKDSAFVTGAVDLVSQSAVLGELGALAVDLGIPEFAEAWVEKAHESVKDVVWAKVGSAAIFKSDLITLNKALDGGAGAFIERYVDRPANALLSNFQSKVKGKIDSTLDETWGELKGTLDKLDSSWDKAIVNGVERIKLDNFFDISPDAKRAMTVDDVYRPIANSISRFGKRFHKDVLSDSISSGTGKDKEIKDSLRFIDTSMSMDSTIA